MRKTIIILDINPTYERLTGFSREQIVGKKITELDPGVSKELIYRHNRVALTGEEDRFEIYEPITGRWYEVNVFSPQKGYFIALFSNITERKRAEEELHKSEKRFRALATAGFSVVYHMSPDWNEMWQLSGSSFLADTTESNRDWLKGYIPVQEHSRVLSAIDEAIRNKSIFELEHRIIQADGSIGWTHSRAVPLFDSEGEIYEWFGTARDITGNKQAEQALVESERNLEEAQRITHVGSWNWNVETGEILCSAETYRIYGEEPFSFPVTESIYLEYVHPEDREYVKI
jgi:PAS domain S-box-containing protein